MTMRRGVDVFQTSCGPVDIGRYRELLSTKIHISEASGLDVELSDLHPALTAYPFAHQGAIVQWALRGGRRLIAAQFGLGKTSCQCECMRQIHLATGQPTLIIGELNVKTQFQVEDGPRLGMDIQYVYDDASVANATSPYLYTNYERVRDGAISPEVLKRFIAVSLDEASVLADYGSKTFQTFSTLFKDTPYKFCATATPARNKYKELLHYAHWLGIADSGHGLTRYFKRNSQKANELTLMESMEQEFWLWVASWGLFVEKPSDIGYPDDSYIMPEMEIKWIRLASDHQAAWEQMDGWGQRYLLANAAAGVTQAAREKRRSMPDRIGQAVEIVRSHPGEHFILWHHLEDERKLINQLLPEAVDLYGSQPLEEKEARILGFSHGKFPILSTKPEIAGKGCNFQRYCHNMIFCGVQYKFEDWIQAIHRLLRYGQAHKVKVWIIYTDAEDEIVRSLQAKNTQHRELVENTTAIIRKYGLTSESMKTDLRRTMGVQRREFQGELFTAVHNDCVEEMPNLADNSVDLIVTSIPFGNQYEYTESYNDFGHNPENARFWEQMDFLIPQLYRVLKPGRIAAIHVKDRILYGNVTGEGVPTVEPFSDDCSYSFRKHGFKLLTRRTIVNDVVRENNTTYRLGYSEMLKDATKMGSGMPEYLLIFRKPQSDRSRGYADEPVTHDREAYTLYHWQVDASEYWRSSGDRLITPEDLAQMDISQIYRWYAQYTQHHVYDYAAHRELGSDLAAINRLPKTFMLFAPGVPPAFSDSVWSVHDYSRMNTLNNKQSQRRQENHLCPLPLDIVRRAIEQYSNPGELVLDPFAGVHTTPYVAITTGRRGYGIELNELYWRQGVEYCEEAELKHRSPTLFDLLEYEKNGHTNGHAELEIV